MSKPITKRNSIARAALELFVEKGVEGATTREIARRAGAAEGTMFRHFASKEELAWRLFDDNLALVMKDLEAAAAGRPSTREKLRAMIHACYAFYERDPVLCRFIILSENTLIRKKSADYRTPADLVLAVVQEGLEKGEIRPMDPNLAAALFFGAVVRVPLFKIYGRLDGDLRALADDVAESVWRAIGNDSNSMDTRRDS